jgi:hypothetical protein
MLYVGFQTIPGKSKLFKMPTLALTHATHSPSFLFGNYKSFYRIFNAMVVDNVFSLEKIVIFFKPKKLGKSCFSIVNSSIYIFFGD